MNTDARMEIQRRYPRIFQHIPAIRERALVLEDRVSGTEWRAPGQGDRAVRFKIFQTTFTDLTGLYDVLYSLYSNEALYHHPLQCWVLDPQFNEVTTLEIDPTTRICYKRDRLQTKLNRVAFIVSTWCECAVRRPDPTRPGPLAQVILLEMKR